MRVDEKIHVTDFKCVIPLSGRAGVGKLDACTMEVFLFFFALVSQSAFLPFEATTLQHIYEKRKKNYIIHYFSSNTTDDRKDSSVIKRYQILKHNS